MFLPVLQNGAVKYEGEGDLLDKQFLHSPSHILHFLEDKYDLVSIFCTITYQDTTYAEL